jgi:hypothetical protein
LTPFYKIKKLIMKKLLVGAMVLGAFSMTSCKKEISCDCVSLTTLETTVKTAKAKEGDEAAACQDEAEKLLGLPLEVCVPQ